MTVAKGNNFNVRDSIIALFFTTVMYIVWDVRTDVKTLLVDMSAVKTEHLQVAKDISLLKNKVFGENITSSVTDKFFKNEEDYRFKREN